MGFRFFAGVIAALILSSAPVVAAAGDPSLLVADFPGYEHVSSTIDGEINGATLVQASASSADTAIIDRARSHSGQGRAWRSADGATVAIAWVLGSDSEAAAANLATGLTLGAWQSGTPFDPGLSGTTGVSISRNGAFAYSVFWRQGTYIAAVSVSGPDATRAEYDATRLAGLEADTLQHAIGGERTTLGLPDSNQPATPKTRRHADLTPAIVVGAVVTRLTAAALILLGTRHRPPPLPSLPPLPSPASGPPSGSQSAKPGDDLVSNIRQRES